MGLLAIIFRADDRDFSAGGISLRHDRVCIVDVDGPFQPSDTAPAVRLVKGPMNSIHAVPVDCEGKWTAMGGWGGCFVYTSDSRFTRAVEQLLGHGWYGAVALHDRVE
jgi:hypothetical protein